MSEYTPRSLGLKFAPSMLTGTLNNDKGSPNDRVFLVFPYIMGCYTKRDTKNLSYQNQTRSVFMQACCSVSDRPEAAMEFRPISQSNMPYEYSVKIST